MNLRSLVTVLVVAAAAVLIHGLAAGAAEDRRARWLSEQEAVEADAAALQVELTASRERVDELARQRSELRAALDPEVNAAVADVNRLVRERRCAALGGTPPPGLDMDHVVDVTIAEVASAHPGIPDPASWRGRLDTAAPTFEACFPPPPPPPEPVTVPESASSARSAPPEAAPSRPRTRPAPRGAVDRAERRSRGGPPAGGCRAGRC